MIELFVNLNAPVSKPIKLHAKLTNKFDEVRTAVADVSRLSIAYKNML